MARQDTDLPFGDAFSPAQLDTEDGSSALSILLDLATDYRSQPYEFDKEIAKRFFPDSNDSLTRAKNVRLGMGPAGYGLADDQFEFTVSVRNSMKSVTSRRNSTTDLLVISFSNLTV